jgi:hypothetical protein
MRVRALAQGDEPHSQSRAHSRSNRAGIRGHSRLLGEWKFEVAVTAMVVAAERRLGKEAAYPR